MCGNDLWRRLDVHKQSRQWIVQVAFLYLILSLHLLPNLFLAFLTGSSKVNTCSKKAQKSVWRWETIPLFYIKARWPAANAFGGDRGWRRKWRALGHKPRHIKTSLGGNKVMRPLHNSTQRAHGNRELGASAPGPIWPNHSLTLFLFRGT